MNTLQQSWFNPTLLIFSLVGIGYLLYFFIFSYFTVRMQGDYDVSKKTLGKSLPPYPNGWYIACKAADLLVAATKAVDLSGHNITLVRTTKGIVYGIHSYCAHMGANLGIDGKVVNEKCVQCPFHGWLYDAETGICVDHDGKHAHTKTIEYNDDFGSKSCKSVQWKQGNEQARQRKYHVKQVNGFIYVWIHSDPTVAPYFMMLDNSERISRLSNRGQTIHDINCHIQDIPENGADIFHFKYIHKYLIGRFKMLEVSWAPKWKRGDDPTLQELFQHRDKHIRAYKQELFHKLVKPMENKQYYSFANVDNYLMLPIFGPLFVFNLTIIQMGPGIVNIYLKTRFFQVFFCQYIQTQSKFHQRLYHEMFTSHWLPYWLSSIFLYAEGMQVYYDMNVWNSKRISYKLYYKENQADTFIRGWRGWFSQHYQGCDVQLQDQGIDW